MSRVQTIIWTSSCQLLHGLLLVLWYFLQKALPDDVTLNILLFSSSRKHPTNYFVHMQISNSEFVIPLCYGYQVVHLALYVIVTIDNSWLLLHIAIQLLTIVVNVNSHSHKEDMYVTSQVSTGLALQLVVTKVMARGMTIFSAWAVIKG